MANKLPHMQSPCKGCPFKKTSLKGWLGKKRMMEIIKSDSFVCHNDNSKQCAGHMHLLGKENMYVRQAGRLNIDLGLTNKELIFESREKCIEHHNYDKIEQ